MKKEREKWLDAAKTIAIFIVLLNHAGITIPGVNFWGGMFYVAIFFVLSGYTYKVPSLRKNKGFWEFVSQKMRRLIVPYFIANIFLICFFTVKEMVVDHGLHTVTLQSIIGVLYARNRLLGARRVYALGALKDVSENNIYWMQLQNGPTWFLPALFLSLVLFEILVRFAREDHIKIGFCNVFLLVASLGYHYVCPVLLPWSIDALPFFMTLLHVGYMIKEKDSLSKFVGQCRKRTFGQQIKVALLVAVLFIISAIVNGSSNLSIAEYGKSMVLCLFNCVGSSYLVMLVLYFLEFYFEKNKLPKWLYQPGTVTLQIMCYHMLVFSILGSFITIGCMMLGVSTNVVIMTLLKLLMIVFTIALFDRVFGEKQK